MVEERRSVVVLTPSDDRVATQYAASMFNMIQATILAQPENLSAFAVQMFGSTILPFSRQTLADYAIEKGATHTLWIDSDMSFPADTILRLLKRDEPIIGVNAMSRRAPFRCTAQTAPNQYLETNIHSTGMEKVHRMGFGMVWIATEVFKAMEPPFFDFEWNPELKCWRGEDYHFFEKARELGHDFYVDHDLSKEVGHHGDFRYNPVLMAAQLAGGVAE